MAVDGLGGKIRSGVWGEPGDLVFAHLGPGDVASLGNQASPWPDQAISASRTPKTAPSFQRSLSAAAMARPPSSGYTEAPTTPCARGDATCAQPEAGVLDSFRWALSFCVFWNVSWSRWGRGCVRTSYPVIEWSSAGDGFALWSRPPRRVLLHDESNVSLTARADLPGSLGAERSHAGV